MLEHVPVLDQNYIATLTPFLDQSGIATSGVSIVVDGVEMKGTGVSASAIQESHGIRRINMTTAVNIAAPTSINAIGSIFSAPSTRGIGQIWGSR